MRPTRRPAPPRSAFAGFRFACEVIVLAVRWYLRFGMSYRDVEELLAGRGRPELVEDPRIGGRGR
jgi:transposase-like protein